MGYRVLYRSDAVEYDTLKHSLVIDDVWDDRGSASLSAKAVTSLTGAMPFKVTCNTISSVTFGGSVRGWSWRKVRSNDATTWDIDVDDWRTYLNRKRFCKSYTAVRIDSIARDLIGLATTSFSTTGIHSMMSTAGSLVWSTATVTYRHDCTVSEALDSLCVLATPPDATDPPVWGVTPDRVVHLVGVGNSYGTTVTIDDADLNLRTMEVAEIGNSICTQVFIWGGSSQVVMGLSAGANSLRVYNGENFAGYPTYMTYPDVAMYATTGTELIPVVTANSISGDTWVGVSSLNVDGVQHSGMAMNAFARMVLKQTLPAVSLNVTSLITGEGGEFAVGYDASSMSWPMNPILLNSIAYAQMVMPGSELGLLRFTTTNSQVASGGRLVVSLTAAGARRGVYRIQRVRIAGFDRGESAAPIYEVEAGLRPRYRINSLL